MEWQKEVFPRGRKEACYVGKGKKGVNFPEEGVGNCTGENNSHLQWTVYNKVVCNMGSIIRPSGSNICSLLAVQIGQGT